MTKRKEAVNPNQPVRLTAEAAQAVENYQRYMKANQHQPDQDGRRACRAVATRRRKRGLFIA